MVFDTFSSKEHEILTGTVLRIEPATGDMTIRIGGGNDKTDAHALRVRAGPHGALYTRAT